MDNTTVLLMLAIGGVAVWAMTRKPEVRVETVRIEPAKLTTGQKIGGAVETFTDLISWG